MPCNKVFKEIEKNVNKEYHNKSKKKKKEIVGGIMHNMDKW
jgi:hypothetical protein